MSYSTRNKIPEREVNMRALIPSIVVGKIIGKKEKFVNELRKKYEAEITISDKPPHGKQLIHTFGRPAMLSKLWKDVFFKLFNYPDKNDFSPDILGIEFLAADAFVNTLSSENSWKKIAEKSKTRILIRSNNLPDSTERVIYIAVPNFLKANIVGFSSAVYLFSKELEQRRTIALSFPGNKFYIVPNNSIIIDDWTENDQDTIYDYSNTYTS